MAYPARNADTMMDAIALSSPSGKISKRARREAERRLSLALFGSEGLQREPTPQPNEKTQILEQAARLRDLANRGMSVRRYNKEADRLEREASAL